MFGFTKKKTSPKPMAPEAAKEVAQAFKETLDTRSTVFVKILNPTTTADAAEKQLSSLSPDEIVVLYELAKKMHSNMTTSLDLFRKYHASTLAFINGQQSLGMDDETRARMCAEADMMIEEQEVVYRNFSKLLPKLEKVANLVREYTDKSLTGDKLSKWS